MRGPRLEGAALAAVRQRGSHLQIIAAAGSGKTEVLSQRVADLLADGVAAGAIVAFTFTERAAAELRQRIAERAEDRPAERRPLPLPATPGRRWSCQASAAFFGVGSAALLLPA